MKAIKKETLENGTIIITVETKILGIFKKKTKYSSNRIIVGKFRDWVKEPTKELISDTLSFQLDKWNELML